jgi:hypothetical protein
VLAAANTGGYVTMNSTGAASAVVAGVVALIRSRYPDLSPASIRKVLTSTTMYRRAGGLAVGSGYGAVNADKAMTAAAVLGTPPADRAGAGALPRVAPAAVRSAAATHSIGHQLRTAAEVSGGLLLLLLLLIVGYAAAGRRRRRSGAGPSAAPQWTDRQVQSRYPRAAGADADPMLEFFAAPAAGPGVARSAGQHAVQGSRPARPASAHAAQRSGYADEGLFAPMAERPTASAPPVPPTPAGPEPGRWTSHGPASRAVSKRAAVTGTPPWEPASAPDSELPWTAASGRAAGPDSYRAQPPAAPASNLPEPTASPGWPGPRQPEFAEHDPFGDGAFEGAGSFEAADPFGSPDLAGYPVPFPTPSGSAAPDRFESASAFESPDAFRSPAPYPARGQAVPSSPYQPADYPPADYPPAAYPPDDPFARPYQFDGSGQFDRPEFDGSAQFDRPAQFDGSGQFDRPTQFDRPAQFDGSGQFDRPTQFDRPGQFNGPAQYGEPDQFAAPTQAEAGGYDFGDSPGWDARPRTTASGLPVRTPRATNAAPLSPSGSLFEPAEGSSLWEPASGRMMSGQDEDAPAQPIFSWNPGGETEAFPAYPAE